jgi:hypothetical protein
MFWGSSNLIYSADTEVLLFGVKRLVVQAEHLLAASAVVKNARIYASASLCASSARFQIKNKEN